ncbi:Phage integrase family protein [Pseudooceanicola nitratireducens]|uniref:Phage integrase family protein n=2 Tax=Pseudooceanicola nitratireducens TaxID=517719 RepID=A0A1I1MDS2_9RHOB|nr:Phage integrase family protein [Pseudooceanicola nitratireducens]SFC83601.1 Phage integrase family protein [Pseudooceanicola nitratireducens]
MFQEYYDAARLGRALEIEAPKKSKTGSLDNLSERFIDWMQDRVMSGNLSKLTLSSRTTGLNQACDTLDPDGDRMGTLSADLPIEAFQHIVDGFGVKTGAADTCLKALRAAYTWGKTRGFPKHSAVFEAKSGHKSKGGALQWDANDIGKYLSTHGPGSMARLWFCLAYDSHGRIGDMHRLGRENEVMHGDDRYLEWQPSKKGSAFVSIPFGEMLAAELEHHDERDTYLVTEAGAPFASSGALDNKVRKWIIEAGLCVDATDADGEPIYVGKGKRKIVKKVATRSQHGIRKGVAAMMANSGASEFEIMASFGWTEAKTAAIYTKKFARRGSAASASKRMASAAEACKSTKGVPRPVPRGTPSD